MDYGSPTIGGVFFLPLLIFMDASPAFSADALPDADVFPVSASQPRARVAIIPAAGFGTRLRPLTDALPKEMLPVGRYLALERIVSELRHAGMTRIVFVLSPAKLNLIRARFGDSGDGVTFAYAVQAEMRGLGDAILCAEPFLTPGEPFIVALGDAVFEEPNAGGVTSRLADAVAARGADTGLVVQRVAPERISRYGVVKPADGADVSEFGGAAFAISGIVEKPAPREAPSPFAAAARYALPWAIFDTLRETAPGKGGEIQLTDAIKTRLEAGLPGVAVPLRPDEVRHDIGGLDSYFKAFIAFALADEEQGPGLREYLKTILSEERPATQPRHLDEGINGK